MKRLVVMIAIGFTLAFGCLQNAEAQDVNGWQSHYDRAEIAYARHNLFEARREFCLALKEAEKDNEHFQLASKLETLASRYMAQEQKGQAEPLFKLARKLKSKFAKTSVISRAS